MSVGGGVKLGGGGGGVVRVAVQGGGEDAEGVPALVLDCFERV